MIQPNFGYFETDGRLVVSLYYSDETGVTKREELTVLKDHIEATELCIKLDAMLPLIAKAQTQFEKSA